MKKVISSALVLLLLCSTVFLAVPASAEEATAEPTPISYSTFDFTQTFADKDNWFVGDQNVTFTNDSMTFTNEGESIIGYHGRTFENEILEFKWNMDLNVEGWPGITLRSKNDENVTWGDNTGYLFVFQGDYIELQRWNGTQKFLLCIPKMPPMKQGENTIQIGAINTDAGVNIILNANGVSVINYLDTDDLAITKPGYVTFYPCATQTFTKLSDTDRAAMPPVALGSSISGTTNIGDTLTASYTYADFSNNAEKDSVVQWYRSDQPLGRPDESEEAQNAIGKYPQYTPPGIFDKIEGATSLEYTLTEEDSNKYLLFTVTPKNEKGAAGIEVRSGIIFIDTLPAKLEQSIVMMVDFEFAYANGSLQQIDPDNWDVMPAIVNDRTLLPIRFVAESLGAEVGWDEPTRTVTIKMDGVDVSMTLDVASMTVNGTEVAMDVAPQVFEETGRTMVPIRAVAEAVGKTVFWDPENQLVIISDDELFDLERDASQLATLAKKMKNDDF